MYIWNLVNFAISIKVLCTSILQTGLHSSTKYFYGNGKVHIQIQLASCSSSVGSANITYKASRFRNDKKAYGYNWSGMLRLLY